jgi:hypothetical protein
MTPNSGSNGAQGQQGVRSRPMAEGPPDIVTDAYLRHNDDVAWDEFDPQKYWQHNYSSLREDDLAIILAVGEYFSGYFNRHPEALGGLGLDVGSGSNLYPALGMLPWTRNITLTDHSGANAAWLRRQLREGGEPLPADASWSWDPFWRAYAKFDGYEQAGDPRQLLADRVSVEQISVFELPEDGRFDIGTMFFVAESMTSYETEFEDATARFLAALRPGAPFAAAFMDKSLGYVVGDKSFPAVREVDQPTVASTLKTLGATAVAQKIPIPGNDPLRDGYDGMIIAVGTAGS